MKLRFVVGVLLIMVAAMCLCACGGDSDGDSDTLTDKEQSEIISAIAQRYEVEADDIPFEFYGKYSGAYVLMIYKGGYFQAISGETVDGVSFRFSEIRHFDVYKSGKFYSLQEAFDKGWVDHDDLLTIKDMWDSENPYFRHNC